MPQGFSKVKIANMALSHVGSKSRIESLSEPLTTTPEKVCALWYDAARLATLEIYNWSFARKSAALAAHSVAAPTNRWAYRYQYPSDCVQARYIENPLGDEADAIPFIVEEADDDTQCILTNQESATLIYTRDLESVERFSMHFTLMMALRLGLFINPELAGKLSRRDRMQREWETMLLQAPAVDNEQSVPKAARDASWIRARS